MDGATQEIVRAEVCGPVRIQIEGFRPIFNEVAFVEMKPADGEYEPLIGYIVLEQSQAAVDMLGHRLVPIKHMDLKWSLFRWCLAKEDWSHNSVANALSKTQIDRLGDRLRKDDITEADLRLLDEYRRSFGKAYELVVGAIQSELGLEPTGRPTKSTTSISEKLLFAKASA